MIQTKKIAMLVIAIATVAVVGSAGILVHANAERGGIQNPNGATVTKDVKCGGPTLSLSGPCLDGALTLIT